MAKVTMPDGSVVEIADSSIEMSSPFTGQLYNSTNAADPELMGLQKDLLRTQIDSIKNPIDPNKSAFLEDPSFKTLIGDKNAMGNIAGLASTVMQAAALPSMLKNARLQNKSLQFNLDTAKQEQARRNKNISAFNSFQG